MSLNVVPVRSNQPLVGGGIPPTSARTSIDRLTDGPGPSVTIRSLDGPVTGSKLGPLEGVKSLKIGAGVWNDIYSRIPYYASDWTDAWNYRVVPATTLIFFANVLPGIAFSLDLIETTGKYGVAEVLLSSAMAAGVFSVFGGQPLCIAGVTGPITVLNKTIYDILNKSSNPPDYLQFMGWVYLWGAIFHWMSALLNWCNFLRYVTLFSCDTFGFYVSWVYLQYGVQVITRQFPASYSGPGEEGGLVGIICALLMVGIGFSLRTLSKSLFFHRYVRRFFADYGMPIALVASSGIAYWGRFNAAHPNTLPIGGAFNAAGGRSWLVKFWLLDGKWVGIALPFGIALWVLFFFDHNVSSLMAQGSEFPLRKPPGFHYDFFLLGITTFVAGLLGLPAPNGLIPQAPIHTASLVVWGQPTNSKRDEEKDIEMEESHNRHSSREAPVSVVEQHVSNLVQGALCLVLLTGPFLHVLSLIPRGVLAGLFWYMGLDALNANGITTKIYYLIRDKATVTSKEPLQRVRRSRILLFVVIQLVGFGATMVITQTIAAIGFPIVISLLIPLRTMIIPRLPFTEEELAILDGPTASPFTMESVGGTL